MWARIWRQVKVNGSIYVRRIQAAKYTVLKTVWRVLHEELLYPYNFQWVQTISKSS
jgi:hypothetical protein